MRRQPARDARGRFARRTDLDRNASPRFVPAASAAYLRTALAVKLSMVASLAAALIGC